MPQISSYPFDVVVQDQDAWIGTDAHNRQTKQYTASAVATYLNTKGKISIGAQLPYQFTSVVASGVGTMSLTSGGVSSFANLTSLKIHKDDLGGGDTVKFFEYLLNSDIMISQMNAPSIFGHYKISTYSVDSNNPNLYNINLNHIGSNGSLVNDYYYDIFNFTLASASDKTFVFTQGVPATTWTIQHNLGKFPSVGVVDTASVANGQLYYGDVKYIDSNNLTITFASEFSGKAYLN
tara:strand:+ start:4187 stop:4894 length:708 start_codon:yes stop_codon:yes gene_type:complete